MTLEEVLSISLSSNWATGFSGTFDQRRYPPWGDDFDQVLIDWLADQFKEAEGMDLRQDPMALQRLKEAVRKSQNWIIVFTEAVNLPYVTATASGPKHLVTTLTRSKFEQLSTNWYVVLWAQ